MYKTNDVTICWKIARYGETYNKRSTRGVIFSDVFRMATAATKRYSSQQRLRRRPRKPRQRCSHDSQCRLSDSFAAIGRFLLSISCADILLAHLYWLSPKEERKYLRIIYSL